MARATAALALLHRIFVLKVDLKSVHPVLHESVRAVSVHHVSMESKLAEALQSMKLSARGSIWKKTNIIQAVVIVKNLYQHGLSDFGLCVRKWNAMSTQVDHSIGKMARALKLLFESAPQGPEREGRGGRRRVAYMLC